jgi:hydrophobe/amphiphile efflux-1 (HAE1) family protein
MTLSDVAIKRPVFAWMLMIGLIVFGWISFQRMGIGLLPDVEFPVLQVIVTLEGAAPEVMETEVADVIEDAVMGVQGIREVSSQSFQGRTQITIELELGRDIDVALQEVQTKIAQVQRNLPRGIDPPNYLKINPEEQPFMWLAASGGKTSTELMTFVRDYLKDQYTTVKGVGDVFLGGYVEPNLRVWLDGEKMRQYEITVDDIVHTIADQHAEIPAGIIDTGKQELNVRVMGEARTVQDFENIIISKRQNAGQIWRTLRLKDVARVEDGLNDIRKLSRNNGLDSVGLGIMKVRGANTVAVGEAVLKKTEQLRKMLPEGFQIRVAYDGTHFVKESVRELNFTLLLSAILTSIVCYFFLGSWSSTFNVLMAIPTSVIGAFTFLYFAGFTLNTFTLLGLSLALGIVVDDAIMMLENIVRKREEGLPRVAAAIIGAREITFAAIAASVAVLAIFVPVIFMKGVVGQFLFVFGITLAVTVLISLLEALTLAPMRCSQFLEIGRNSWIGRRSGQLMDWMASRYTGILRWCLGHRWTVLAASLIFFIGSLSLLKLVKSEFVPAQDQGMLFLKIETPAGTSLKGTDAVVRLAEQWFKNRPDVVNFYSAVGGFEGGEVNSGMMFVTLKEARQRPAVAGPDGKPKVWSQQELMALVSSEFQKFPGIERVIVQDLSLSGFTASRGFPIEFTLQGPEWGTLAKLSDDVQSKMKRSGMMTDIDSDYRLGQPEVRVFPNREKAAKRGVSVISIGNAINATIGGIRAGKYTKGGKRYDVRVRLIEGDRLRADDIKKIWVRNEQGEVIRLSEVTDVVTEPTLLSISRKNRERAISIFANVAKGHSQEDALKSLQGLQQQLPPGYRIVLSGTSEAFKESGQSLMIAMILGIFVAYMVLASQFNSFIHPFTVLLALPFSLTGALLALWLGHQTLNLYSMIGIVLLMGIVKKNSILLVDFTNERRARGKNVFDALMEACPVRLRPIVMTSVATIAGAVPPALGIGPGAETRVPMALTVIGGVTVSTFLTLFVVPCAYSLLAKLQSHKHDADLKQALIAMGELPAETAGNGHGSTAHPGVKGQPA